MAWQRCKRSLQTQLRANLGRAMALSRPSLVVAFELSQKRKAIVADPLAGASAVVYLTELDEAARAEALRNTGVLLTTNPFKELRPGEIKLLEGAGLIQFMIGGVDVIPLGELPEGVPVATNGGGYAESMAEHALAMALARQAPGVGTRKPQTWPVQPVHAEPHAGRPHLRNLWVWRHRSRDRSADARYWYAGACLNRHGRTDQRVDWIGTPERLNELLEAADVLLISAPLTRATYGFIGAAELRRMKARCHSRQLGPRRDRAGEAVV